MQSQPGYQNCSITNTGIHLVQDYLAFALPKDSPYRQLFNWHLLALRESGELDKIVKRYSQVTSRGVRKEGGWGVFQASPTCGGSLGRALDLASVASGGAVLAMGLAGSLVLLVMELVAWLLAQEQGLLAKMYPRQDK